MSIKWRCTLCGQCCSSYTAFVLPGDVERLQESLQRPMSTFITFYRASDFEGTLAESDQHYLFRTKRGPMAMCLSRVNLPEGDPGCVFLRDGLCSAHQHRPLVCRQYPFLPQDPANVEGPFELMGEPCFGRYAKDETIDETSARQNYRLFQGQQEEYLRKLREWDAAPSSKMKDVEDFLSFMGIQWS